MWAGVSMAGSVALDIRAHSRQLSLSSSLLLSKSDTWEMELAEKNIEKRESEFWGHQH